MGADELVIPRRIQRSPKSHITTTLYRSGKGRTVNGRKSRTGSEDLAAATVARTLVSSMEITTEPFAKRAIFPVSKAMGRPPISNSSRKLSSTFRPGAGGAAAASAAASSAAPERNAARAPGTARGAAGKRRRGRRRARERREAAAAIDMVAGGERGGAGEGRFFLSLSSRYSCICSCTTHTNLHTHTTQIGRAHV